MTENKRVVHFWITSRWGSQHSLCGLKRETSYDDPWEDAQAGRVRYCAECQRGYEAPMRNAR